MDWTERRERFRGILNGSRCFHPASVYDAMSARIAEDLGYEVGMLAGSTGSLSVLGEPVAVPARLTLRASGHVLLHGVQHRQRAVVGRRVLLVDQERRRPGPDHVEVRLEDLGPVRLRVRRHPDEISKGLGLQGLRGGPGVRPARGLVRGQRMSLQETREAQTDGRGGC